MKARLHHLVLLSLLAGCDTAQPAGEEAAAVNGVRISEAEVALRMGADAHAGGGDRRAAALDAIVAQELLAQRALELGLELGAKEKEQLASLEAQVAAFKRKHLADAASRDLARRVVVTEAEARRRFEESGAKVRAQLHLFQILRRGDGAIHDAAEALDHGKSFEEVAGEGLPRLPEGRAPWDLGWLRYEQIPAEWREVVYAMKDGETSGVIAGPRDRFWILKLIERREDTAARFEDVKATLIETIKREKVEALFAETDAKLRAAARITRR